MDKEKEKEVVPTKAKIKRRGLIYSLLGGGMLAFALAVVLVVLGVSGAFSSSLKDVAGTSPDVGKEDNAGKEEEPPKENPVAFVNPLDGMYVVTENGFFYDSTLDCYYSHTGIDASAEAGSNVYAVTGGRIREVYSDDVLLGGEVVLEGDNGITTVYNFISPAKELKAGDRVEQGQVLGTVMEATGIEHKCGPHLHIEMYSGTNAVDPADYLTLSEK